MTPNTGDCVICDCHHAFPTPNSVGVDGAVAYDIYSIEVDGKAMMPMMDIRFDGGLKQNTKNITLPDVSAWQVIADDGGGSRWRRKRQQQLVEEVVNAGRGCQWW